jgi:hypothetical protein
MQKQDAWAAATSSSGLVRPSADSVRDAQVTGNSEKAPLVDAETTPLPDIRSPRQTAFAVRITAIYISF